MLIGAHSEGLATVRGQIAAAAARANRDPGSITLVAVSKTQPAEAIRALRDLGVTDFGESYVQEGIAKIDALGALPGIHWHFIGQLQSNKTRPVAERFDWVHSVDRIAIARRLSAQRPFHAPPLNVCLQVRIADEPSKGGVMPADLGELTAEVARLDRLRLRGLMCLPPQTDDPVRQRSWFRQLRELFEQLKREGYPLDALSMGMSGDFPAAIEEGATHVRIGTAIFGARRTRGQ